MPTTFNTAHILHTLSGTMPGGDMWSIGIRTGEVAAGITEADLTEFALEVGNAFIARTTDAPNGLFRLNPTTMTFTSVVSRHVSELGVTTAQSPVVPFSQAGYAVGQLQPNQICVVATLLTPKAGRSGKGRIYLPLLALPSVAGDRMDTLHASNLAQQISAWIEDVNAISTATAGPFRVSVQSRLGAGTPGPVTGVGIGDVLDTQRRRRNKVVESYSIEYVTP